MTYLGCDHVGPHHRPLSQTCPPSPPRGVGSRTAPPRVLERTVLGWRNPYLISLGKWQRKLSYSYAIVGKGLNQDISDSFYLVVFVTGKGEKEWNTTREIRSGSALPSAGVVPARCGVSVSLSLLAPPGSSLETYPLRPLPTLLKGIQSAGVQHRNACFVGSLGDSGVIPRHRG